MRAALCSVVAASWTFAAIAYAKAPPSPPASPLAAAVSAAQRCHLAQDAACVVRLSEAVRASSGGTLPASPEAVELERLAAFAYAALDRSDDARSAFVRLLRIRPQFKLSPRATAPRVFEAFARAWLDVRGQALATEADVPLAIRPPTTSLPISEIPPMVPPPSPHTRPDTGPLGAHWRGDVGLGAAIPVLADKGDRLPSAQVEFALLRMIDAHFGAGFRITATDQRAGPRTPGANWVAIQAAGRAEVPIGDFFGLGVDLGLGIVRLAAGDESEIFGAAAHGRAALTWRPARSLLLGIGPGLTTLLGTDPRPSALTLCISVATVL